MAASLNAPRVGYSSRITLDTLQACKRATKAFVRRQSAGRCGGRMECGDSAAPQRLRPNSSCSSRSSAASPPPPTSLRSHPLSSVSGGGGSAAANRWTGVCGRPGHRADGLIVGMRCA